MIFASDNGAGAAPQILEAIAAASHGAAPAYGARRLHRSAPSSALAEIFETRGRRLPRRHRHRPPMRLALARWRAPGRRFSATRRRMSTTTNAARRSFSPAAPSSSASPATTAKSRRMALNETLARYPRGLVKSCSRRADALPGHRGRHGLSPRRDRRACRDRPRGRRLRPYGRRAFRQCARRAGCSPADMTWRAGVDALSFGATKNGALACEAVVFFDQESARNFPICASAAAIRFPRAGCSARKWRPI